MVIDYKREIIEKINIAVSYYNGYINPSFIIKKDYLMWLYYYNYYAHKNENEIQQVLNDLIKESYNVHDYSLWFGKSGMAFFC